MRKSLFAVLLSVAFFATSFSALAYVSVKGYTKSNGTYVAPHVRSEPNGLKYDNYGYKPSQGLYNDTYGTRGSTWDTPTWNTDPDYYEGKNLYEQGYTVDKRPKGMSKRQFNALTVPSKTASVKNSGISIGAKIDKEINNVEYKYRTNPQGFRERLIGQIADYLGIDREQIAASVYRRLGDIK